MTSFATRMSRWDRITSPALPVIDTDGTALPTNVQAIMTAEQMDAYVAHFRIQEITNKLRLSDATLSAQDHQHRRTPSPDPEYDAAGRRTNTRCQRRRQALQLERHRLIEGLSAELGTCYKAPSDYRRPTRFTECLFIPKADFPTINFIGQILGPRGATLREMEERSGVTIALRGKGSVKEGKVRQSARKMNDGSEAQPLHALITASSQAKVDKGKELVQKIIDDAITIPEWQNEHKRGQLRDLAIRNGTFQDYEGRREWQGRITDIPSSAEKTPSSLQRTRSSGGLSAEIDLDVEYRKLMEEMDAESSRHAGTDGQQQNLAALPPWRVDRLRRKGQL